MEKKGFMGRLRILSKPTGKPQWKLALKSILLMILAALIAKFLGLDQGIEAIMFMTLIATIFIDLPLPLRKIVPMAFVGFFMAFLAFISSSLALSSLPVFLFFTVVWAFFSLSMYIFNETVGLFGFMIFAGYFMSVILVNRDASTLDWGIYIILAYLVASILFIPKIWGRKKDLKNMIASPFAPATSLEYVLSTRQALSGLPLDKRDYELFRVGTYLSGFRGYSKLMLSRLSDQSQEIFRGFMDVANETSLRIASSIKDHPNPVELEPLNIEITNIQKISDSTDQRTNALIDVSKDIKSLLERANKLLMMDYPSSEKNKISSPRNSLKDVLAANFNLKNMYIRHALRFSIAITLGLLAVYLFHDRDAIWITMGILIIIKPDVTSTLNNIIVRVSFNLLAIFLAIIIGSIFPHQMLLWLGFLMIFFFRAFYPTYMGLSVMALSVFVVLVWPTGFVWENAIARIIDICIGAIIAFVCAYMILPSRMTVDLPEQIAKIIRSNSKYAESILPSKDRDYNHENAVLNFRNYMLEEKNTESAIKKVEDTFNDVEDDLSAYNNLITANKKLAADLSALATLIESGKSLTDFSHLKEQITNALNEMALSVDKNVILPRARIDDVFLTSKSLNHSPQDNSFEPMENYLNWIISDIHYMQEVVEIAYKSGALKRYRDMT